MKKDEENSFLAKSSDPAKAKKIITRLILSTDMSYHFKNIEALKE